MRRVRRVRQVVAEKGLSCRLQVVGCRFGCRVLYEEGACFEVQPQKTRKALFRPVAVSNRLERALFLEASFNINHFFRHTPVHNYILPGNEPILRVHQKGRCPGNVIRDADSANRVLGLVFFAVDGRGRFRGFLPVPGLDPARADAVDADFRAKADRQGMGQGDNAAFGSGVSFGIGF